ncbi:hypothetical protein [Fundicoccus culcitae]|uniref:Uncharacterized protein n=1 Tax=Fundicoccus culcitae TaxID=2969821 RepID=A0ABY5P8Y6_9LACT|nr:hypothetical protein [Fundicoccus culcitae]UUX35211.1 hypothetical protein NRE15_06090 [Fundicoccus culcitae]
MELFINNIQIVTNYQVSGMDKEEAMRYVTEKLAAAGVTETIFPEAILMTILSSVGDSTRF